MIQVSNLTKKYENGFCALKNISFALPTTGLVCITGKSGSGKSTLLNCMYGNLTFDGDIKFDSISTKSQDFVEQRKNIVSFVYQDYKLLENFSVFDNLKIALENSGQSASDEVVISLLNKVGLDQSFLHTKCKNLSSGQKQRVAIARCLGQKNKIIFADEPTGNLDKNNANSIFDLFKKLSQNILIVVVTHNSKLAMQYGDFQLVLSGGTVEKTNLPCNLKPCENVENKEILPSKLSFGSNFLVAKVVLNKKLVLALVSVFFIVFFVLASVLASFLKADHLTLLAKNSKIKDECIVQVASVKVFSKFSTMENFENQIFYSFKNNDLLSSCELSDLQFLQESYLMFDDFDTNINIIECDDISKVGGKLLAGGNAKNFNQIVVNESFAKYYLAVGSFAGKPIKKYSDILGCKIGDFEICGVLDANFGLYDKKALKLTREEFLHLEEKQQEKYVALKQALSETNSLNTYVVKQGYSENSKNLEYSLNKNIKNGDQNIFNAINFSSKRNIEKVVGFFENQLQTSLNETKLKTVITSPFANGILSVAEFFESFSAVFIAIFASFLLVEMLFIFFFVYILLNKSKKEFKILFDIGVSKKVIVKNTMIAFLCVSVLLLAIALCCYQAVLFGGNSVLSAMSSALFDVVFFEWQIVLPLALVAITLAQIFCLFLCGKIFKKL